MNIAFFISNHGYGHIMREVPVISYLATRGNNVLVISGKEQVDLAREYLSLPNVTFIEEETDCGIIVKSGTIAIDEKKTAEAVDVFLAKYPQKINWAKTIFNQFNVEKVVVDIVPWSIIAAKELHIETFFMASFTWIDQYGYCISDDAKKTISDAICEAENILYYDLCNQNTKKMLGNGIEVGLVSRDFDDEKVSSIRRTHDRDIVFLSLGGSNSGLDFEIDVSNIDYDFITTGNIKLKGENVYYLDNSVNDIHNYIKAAKYSVSKPGWTTTAETLLAGTPMALIERPEVREDSMTIEMVLERNAGLSISIDKLKDMSGLLNEMENHKWSNKKYHNQYKTIAEIIEKNNRMEIEK